jgi:hypothetical protein
MSAEDMRNRAMFTAMFSTPLVHVVDSLDELGVACTRLLEKTVAESEKNRSSGLTYIYLSHHLGSAYERQLEGGRVESPICNHLHEWPLWIPGDYSGEGLKVGEIQEGNTEEISHHLQRDSP